MGAPVPLLLWSCKDWEFPKFMVQLCPAISSEQGNRGPEHHTQ